EEQQRGVCRVEAVQGDIRACLPYAAGHTKVSSDEADECHHSGIRDVTVWNSTTRWAFRLLWVDETRCCNVMMNFRAQTPANAGYA
ncbi:MAG: hypothetical protein ACKOB6_03665, partial [Candidatus Kapaibacterium sp.]